ncbi:MAG TPA: isoprenylcysteine carboxylmethyltransferase family protein [Bdellovibrionota bacterium]|jgi:protein-S-isoprenylcysteine O-methyltransferase Ste14|nr:isoprenylcysteine carboxylmethyltransferase family protein [Bdellovibrionota bacterium]
MTRQLAVEYNSYLWFLLGVVWIVSAFFTRRTARRESALNRAIHLLTVAVPLMMLFTPMADVPFVGEDLLGESPVREIAGIALNALGLAFAIWARYHLGKNWSGTVTVKEGHELIRTGPYSIVRNPIYTGLILAYFGSALSQGRLGAVIGLVILTMAFIRKSRLEEKMMLSHFGSRFTEYQKAAKLIIPGIY